MWDLLKSKVSNFIKQVKGDAEEEIKEIKIEEKPEPLRGMGHAYSPERMACHFPSENRQTTSGKGPSPSAVKDVKKENELEKIVEKEEIVIEEKNEPEVEVVEEIEKTPEIVEIKKEEKKIEIEEPIKIKEKIIEKPKQIIEKKITIKEEKEIKEVKPEIKIEEIKREQIKQNEIKTENEKPKIQEVKQKTEIREKKPEETMKVKVGLTEKITQTILRKIKLNKNKVNEITEELELALIQADVHPEIAIDVCGKINEKLLKSEYSSNKLEEEIKRDLKEIFENEVFHNYPKINVMEIIEKNEKKPYKILFVGPNGAGKTTTIAKFANMIKRSGKKVVISASDTFRAAAIEQTEEHGRRLDVKVIKQNYGADSAAVAFDAIKHAEANNIDVVLIDSAGRQDNNTNLMRELQKIKRITNPDITIFIGEAISGNSLYQQVETYNEIVKLNGIILTKVDCDAKGGAAISIYRESKVPIIYLGFGQKYDDLKLFEPKDIIDNII